MKKIIFIAAIASAVLSSCKPEVKGEQGDAFDKVKGLSGKWEIATFMQQDPNNPIREERDLSDFYVVAGETPTRLNFNKDDKTYTVEAGPGKNYFGAGGAWAFDNDEYPTYLYLYNATDTIETLLGSVVRESDQKLDIELENFCTDADGVKTTTSIYKFSFNRVTE
jgi:Domain of unknown function (DUF5004)